MEGRARWSGATMEDLAKDGGLFDSKYEAHRVTSSRRRDFQTEVARAESSCLPDACRGDADCERLCATERECLAGCGADGAAPPAPPSSSKTSTPPIPPSAAAPPSPQIPPIAAAPPISPIASGSPGASGGAPAG